MGQETSSLSTDLLRGPAVPISAVGTLTTAYLPAFWEGIDEAIAVNVTCMSTISGL